MEDCPSSLARYSAVRALRLLSLALLAACQTTPVSRLQRTSSWAMQLQGLDRPGAVERLVGAQVDMLVIEPTRTIRGMESFPTREIVTRIRTDKLCLAYINIGQAESYRTYWRDSWQAPTAKQVGRPAYLLALDPEGWPGNYPVAYWDMRWRAILWGSSNSLVDMALADGFDGVYLDWVLGFENPTVRSAAHGSVDPAASMLELIRDLRRYARRRRPGFLVVAQNGVDLAGLAQVVDGFSQETLSFTGRPGAAWEDSEAGDLVNPETAALVEKLDLMRSIPIFTVDYALDPAHARRARSLSRAHGFRPFVSRVPLDRLPPP